VNALNTIRRQLASLLFAFYTLIMLNNVIFQHAHRLSDGRIIVHAHPYWPTKGNCPYLPNHHTRNELTLLQSFSHVSYLPYDFLQIELIPCATDTTVLRLFQYVASSWASVFFTFSPRGPPIN
jgi:hypothetical protein